MLNRFIQVIGKIAGFSLIALFCAVTGQAQGQISARVSSAELTLRTQVRDDFNAAARRARVAINTEEFVYASRKGTLIANTGIAGVETLGAEELARGADVLFVLFSTSEKSRLPSGYYKVRVQRASPIPNNQTPNDRLAAGWSASFINAEGRVVGNFPVKVTADRATTMAKAKIKFSAGVTEGGCTVDVHWSGKERDWSIEISINI